MLEKELKKEIAVEVEYRDLIVPVNLSLALKDEGENNTLSFATRSSEQTEESEYVFTVRFVGSDDWRKGIVEKLAVQIMDASAEKFQHLRKGWERSDRLPQICCGIGEFLCTDAIINAFWDREEFVFYTTEVDSSSVKVEWHLRYADQGRRTFILKEGRNNYNTLAVRALMSKEGNRVSVCAKSYSLFSIICWQSKTLSANYKEDFSFVSNDTKILTKNITKYFPDPQKAFERLKEVVSRHSGLSK